MDKFNVKLDGSNLKAGYDGNSDGENSFELEARLGEALQEAMKTGEAVIDVKALTLKFEDGKLMLMLDTDKDGEPVLVAAADIGEGIEEAIGS